MSQKPKKAPKEGKDEERGKLKNKLADRKQQIIRMRRTIRTLEKRIQELENKLKLPPVKKPKKVILSETEKLEKAKQETREKFKRMFSNEKKDNTIT